MESVQVIARPSPSRGRRRFGKNTELGPECSISELQDF